MVRSELRDTIEGFARMRIEIVLYTVAASLEVVGRTRE